MSVSLKSCLIWGSVAALVAACDPNVVIGAKKWRAGAGEPGGQAGVGGGLPSTGGVSGGGGESETGGTETSLAGASGAGDEAGAGGVGAGGMPPLADPWCATAPWVNTPVEFTRAEGDEMPAGNYVVTYISGAQIHDLEIGYEVTARYYQGTLEAGHHIFSGDSVETGATKLWLTSDTLTPGVTVAAVEAANQGHTWPLVHAGGALRITLYDNVYNDNSGPGSVFCIAPAQP